VPDSHRKKLDDKIIECILLCLSDESKAYKLYDPKSKKVVISRNVIFEESQGWNWNAEENIQTSKVLIDDDVIEFTNDVPVNEVDPKIPDLEDISENASSDYGNDPSDHEVEMELESSDESELPPRTRIPLGYLDDYVSGREVEEEEEHNSLDLFSTSLMIGKAPQNTWISKRNCELRSDV